MIKLDPQYMFVFLEERDSKVHPSCAYYLKLDDLSMNLLVPLRWIKWSYFFLASTSSNLDELGSEYDFKNMVTNSISHIPEIKSEKRVLEIDGKSINNQEEFELLLEEFYSMRVFTPSTKIHLKLKVNLHDYILISNVLFPCLLKLI